MFKLYLITWGSPGGSAIKNLPAMQETWVPSLDEEDPPEKGMATYSSVLAWEITWTEKPGGLQSMGLQRAGYNFTAGHTCMRAMLQWVKRKSSVWRGLSVAFGYLKEHLEVQANNYSFKWKFSIFLSLRQANVQCHASLYVSPCLSKGSENYKSTSETAHK